MIQQQEIMPRIARGAHLLLRQVLCCRNPNVLDAQPARRLGLAWRFWQETEPDTRQNLNKMLSFNGLRHSLYRSATAFKSPAGSKSSSIASKPQNKGIIDYYTFSKLDYCLYNGSFSDLSMHYGLWDETTRSHREALANENRLIAEAPHISAADCVIDLGCGYGSSAVWIATHTGGCVNGVTLSEDQVCASFRSALRQAA